MKHYVKRFLLIFSITLLIGLVIFGVLFGGAVLGYWGNVDDLDIDSLTLRQNSSIVYLDPNTGEEKELQKLTAEEDRIWVDLKDTPENLQHAFVAIEDERFYEHRGFDFRRTAKATMTWALDKVTRRSGSASLGGSTITQQLIKNITGEDDQTPARKIREISRAVALEKKMDKDQILELYLNCIYLSQGCSGVQTAANLYFDKNTADLSLAECASLAGITQHPSMYDPFVNPEKNKERQELVLGKMLELGYITQEEYDTAVSETLKIADPGKKEAEKKNASGTTSYFVDQVIRDVLDDLQAQGYSQNLANKILYSGGVKIYSTYNPEIQKILEDYYTDTKNFPKGDAQSAMVITDVQTGQVVGMVGGIGEKPGSLTLNRATSPRQPGSTIKPIGVYAPALEKGLITAGSVYADKATSYSGWTPRNYDFRYRGLVDVRSAVRSSLNTIPVEILSKMGVQESYNFLTQKMGLTTLVSSRDINGKIYTDIGLSQLALGGLTDGATTLEMSAAFAAFANNGVYHKPYTYTEVKDKDNNTIASSDRSFWEAMKPSTAYIMTKMLEEVVASGTGRGAAISGVPTAGKTGTTSENNDRWFIGYTPYYAAAVWYGYDTPKEITLSSNPCIPVFKNVMDKVHKNIKEKQSFEKPDDVISVNYCTYTGKRATSNCPASTFYFSTDNIPAYCNSSHAGYIGNEETDSDSERKKAEDDEDDEEKASGSGSSSSGSSSSGSSSSGNSSSGSGSGSSSSGSGSGSSGSSSSGSSSSSAGSSGNSSSSTGSSGSSSSHGHNDLEE